MFQTDRTTQRQLFGYTRRDLVDPDSDVWLYIDLFEQFDYEEFESSYVPQGQTAKEPKLILRTLFYALTHGVVSGNKLAEVCRNDNRFIVLSGDTRPDRRTFDRFLHRHDKALRNLFVQTVRVAQAMKLVRLGRVAIDGSKFKIKPGKVMTYEKMKRAVEHIENNLTQLRSSLAEANAAENTELSGRLEEDLRDQHRRLERIRAAKASVEESFAEQATKECKKQERMPKALRSLHDPDALSLGASASFPIGYNLQAAVDEESQIVVAAELHDSAADQTALPAMVDKTTENCGAKPVEVLADAGYASLKNIEALQERAITPVIALGREYVEPKLEACEQIEKGPGDRDYKCMAGKSLSLQSRGADGYLVFRFDEEFCSGCQHATQCRMAGKKTTMILDDRPREVMRSYLKRSRSEAFRESYRRRKVIVEPVFGNIKNKGIEILVRGRRAVGRWWIIACTAHNVEKLAFGRA